MILVWPVEGHSKTVLSAQDGEFYLPGKEVQKRG